MRLTTLCFFKQLYKGSMFHGKKRHVKKVTFKAMEELRAEYARQEKIMTLLKHPYLSLVSTSSNNQFNSTRIGNNIMLIFFVQF